jgi:hypothetical protein
MNPPDRPTLIGGKTMANLMDAGVFSSGVERTAAKDHDRRRCRQAEAARAASRKAADASRRLTELLLDYLEKTGLG